MITGITLALKENSQDINKNKTNVTISATISWNGGSYDAIGDPLILKLDGVQVARVERVPFNKNKNNSGSEVFYTYSADIEHNTNGDRTLSCELIYETTRLGGTRKVSKSWTLTPIPRASTIAATAAEIGAVSMISINRRNSAFTHTVEYQFKDLKGYIKDADGNIGTNAVKLTETSISFTIPVSFYEKIPEANSGECTLTCKTYSGQTKVGEDKTCKFRVTANAEDCKPVVQGNVIDINESTLALTMDENVLVWGESKALCTMDVEVKHGATVKTRTIGGSSISGDRREINMFQLQKVEFSVTDSRGYNGTDTVEVQIIPYVPLTCNPVVKRVSPTEDRVVLTVKGKYYNGSFGEAENTDAVVNELHIYYRVATDNGIIDQEIPKDAISFVSDNYTASVELDGFDYRNSYSIKVEARDALKRLILYAAVPKGIPVFDWGENDFNFNVPVSFQGAVFADFVVEQGTTDAGWHYRKWSSKKIELWKQVQLTTALDPVVELGTEGPLWYCSGDTVRDAHGFILSEPIELVTVAGGNDCWLATVKKGIDDCTNEYRLCSFEYAAKTTYFINFYIFANDYE